MMLQWLDAGPAFRRRAFALQLAVAMMLVCFLPAARAQTRITVTNLNGDGPGSLWDAVEHNKSSVPLIITFAPELQGTIPVNIELHVCDGRTVSILGPGGGRIVLSGMHNSRILLTCGGTVTVSGLTFENGLGRQLGGAIAALSPITIINSTFRGNRALDDGGAIFSNTPDVRIINCTFSGNSAAGQGGAIRASAEKDVEITNSTFTGNSAPRGAAIAWQYGRVALTNDTLVGNQGSGSGIAADFHATIAMKSTLLADNAGGNCAIGGDNNLESLGYNLSSDDSCPLNSSGDRTSTPAGLDPNGLQDNGGPTPTIALLSSSPAVDFIPVADCTTPDGIALGTDQRGANRPGGSGCEIGAFELSPTLPFESYQARVRFADKKPFDTYVDAEFIPAAASSPIDLFTQAVTVQVSNGSATIPAGSFQTYEDKRCETYQRPGFIGVCYGFSGSIGNTPADALLTPIGTDGYYFTFHYRQQLGSPVNNSIKVTVVIGDSSGTAVLRY